MEALQRLWESFMEWLLELNLFETVYLTLSEWSNRLFSGVQSMVMKWFDGLVEIVQSTPTHTMIYASIALPLALLLLAIPGMLSRRAGRTKFLLFNLIVLAVFGLSVYVMYALEPV